LRNIIRKSRRRTGSKTARTQPGPRWRWELAGGEKNIPAYPGNYAPVMRRKPGGVGGDANSRGGQTWGKEWAYQESSTIVYKRDVSKRPFGGGGRRRIPRRREDLRDRLSLQIEVRKHLPSKRPVSEDSIIEQLRKREEVKSAAFRKMARLEGGRFGGYGDVFGGLDLRYIASDKRGRVLRSQKGLKGWWKQLSREWGLSFWKARRVLCRVKTEDLVSISLRKGDAGTYVSVGRD